MPDLSRYVDEDLDWLVEEEEAKSKEFDESKHPRDPAGKFTESGGGESDKGEIIDIVPVVVPEGDKDQTHSAMLSTGKKVEKASDFAKDNVALYPEISQDPDREKEFIDTWNTHVKKSPGEFRKEFFGGDKVKGTMNINYSSYGNHIEVRTFLKDDSGSTVGQMTSTIYPDQKRVHMDYYNLDRMQHKGVMKPIMAEQMKIWQDMGIKRVDLLANIDIGGYAWARYGFTPEDNAWYSLSRDLESEINHLSSGGESEGYEASSWDELGTQQQMDIETEFFDRTRDEFIDSEVTSWRDSGMALENAKQQTADNFDQMWSTWGKHAIQGYYAKRDEEGKPPIPFTVDQILNSMSVEYSSRFADGQGDFELTFDDKELAKPMGHDPAQGLLPGVPELEPHEYLTEAMREDITAAMEKAFDAEADRLANDMEPPDFSDQAREFQSEVWEGYSDREKFRWAERHAPAMLRSTTESEGTGDIPEDDAARLKRLTDGGPKNVWAIADSKYGFELLTDKNWDGYLHLDDKDAMERFNNYVAGKGKKER